MVLIDMMCKLFEESVSILVCVSVCLDGPVDSIFVRKFFCLFDVNLFAVAHHTQHCLLATDARPNLRNQRPKNFKAVMVNNIINEDYTVSALKKTKISNLLVPVHILAKYLQ